MDRHPVLAIASEHATHRRKRLGAHKLRQGVLDLDAILAADLAQHVHLRPRASYVSASVTMWSLQLWAVRKDNVAGGACGCLSRARRHWLQSVADAVHVVAGPVAVDAKAFRNKAAARHISLGQGPCRAWY